MFHPKTDIAMDSHLGTTPHLTADFLLSHFGPTAEIDPQITLVQADRAERLASPSQTYRDTRSVDRTLLYLNSVLDYHGVEAIRVNGYNDRYFGRSKYLRLNSGHSYALELYYRTDHGIWIAGCMFDLVESDVQLQTQRMTV